MYELEFEIVQTSKTLKQNSGGQEVETFKVALKSSDGSDSLSLVFRDKEDAEAYLDAVAIGKKFQLRIGPATKDITSFESESAPGSEDASQMKIDAGVKEDENTCQFCNKPTPADRLMSVEELTDFPHQFKEEICDECIIGGQLDMYHDWYKKNLVTNADLTDTYECRRCGKKKKKAGLGGMPAAAHAPCKPKGDEKMKATRKKIKEWKKGQEK